LLLFETSLSYDTDCVVGMTRNHGLYRSQGTTSGEGWLIDCTGDGEDFPRENLPRFPFFRSCLHDATRRKLEIAPTRPPQSAHTISLMHAPDFASRRADFRRLHRSGCFVIPNPWDAGTARYLRGLGFKALATTSGGFAFSRGLPDAEGAISRDMMLAHIAEIVASADLPVNADFQSGYAREPQAVAENVSLCVATGVAGFSIEDATGNRDQPLFELPLAVERIKAARAAIDRSGMDVLLTARAEAFLVGHANPLPESIRRLEAYADAGADVLYAPGPTSRDDVKAIVAAAGSKPVNILLSSNSGLKVADLAELGVRRVSVGSGLSRAAWTGFIRAAKELAGQGSTAGFDGLVTHAELNEFFAQDNQKRL
jgi:2-methylisocitrate lyase-like PEP mutase family enzyme